MIQTKRAPRERGSTLVPMTNTHTEETVKTMSEDSNDETTTATPAIDWAGLARPLEADSRVFNTPTGWTGTKWMQVRGRTLGAKDVSGRGRDQHEAVLALPRVGVIIDPSARVGDFIRVSGSDFNAAAVAVLSSLSVTVAVAIAGPEHEFVSTTTSAVLGRTVCLVGLGSSGQPVAVLVSCQEAS